MYGEVAILVTTNACAAGTMLLLAALAADVPVLFVAVTVNVYAVFVVRPETVSGDAEPVAVKPPGLDVTVKFVIGEPLALPGVNETETLVAEAIDAVTPVGALGTPGVREKATPLP